MVWQPLRDGAQALYLTLSKMEFSLKDYQDILGIFNEKSKTFWDPKDPQLLREVACQWLNEETMLRNGLRSKQYQQWSDIGTSKPKLIIGGIFPIRGTKFRAPELLPGKSPQINCAVTQKLPSLKVRSVAWIRQIGKCMDEERKKTNPEGYSFIWALGPTRLNIST